MKKHILILLSIISFALIGCLKEETTLEVERLTVLKANVEATDLTRVGFSKNETNWSFFWHKDDAIWVNGGKMTTDAETGTRTASFSGIGVNTDKGYAVYPYDKAKDKVTDNKLSWNFPTSYEYTSIDDNFFKTPQEVPMYAVVENGSASFKHLAAICAFKFDEWTHTGKHRFELHTSKKISGDFVVDLTAETPEIKAETSGEDLVTITYDRPAEAEEESIVFYVPVPTGTYDLEIKVYVEDKLKFSKSASNVTVNRKDIVSSVFGKTNGELVTTADEFTNALADNSINTIVLANDLTFSEKVNISRGITIDGNGKKLTYTGSDRAITVENTADGADLTIKDLTVDCTANYCQRGINYNTTGNLTLDNVTVQGTNVTYALNLPGSANGANVTITECDLSGNIALNVWGSNCIINVTDSELTAIDNNSEEGYVAVYLNNDGTTSAENSVININGGQINVTGNECDDTYPYINSTATGHINISNTTTVNGENVEMVAVIRYGENSYSFETLSEAVKFAKDGETVILIRDVTLSDILVIDKAITLDGNGKALTSTVSGSSGRAINISGADGVTVKDLTINASGERAINIIDNATNVSIDNVTATAANYTVNVAGSAENAVVSIKKSILTGLNVVNVGGSGVIVTVTDSEINCVDKTDVEYYGALSINANAAESTIIASNCTFNIHGNSKQAVNGSVSSSIIIDEEIIVNPVIVATIKYGDYAYLFESLEDAVNKAKAGETIYLLRDVTIDEMIKIDNAIILDLNGKTVTATSSKAFEVYGNATIMNGSIVAAERCVDTRTNVKLILTDVALTADSNGKNTQPLTIGGNTDGTTVTMTNVEINAGTSGYGIITFVKTILNATDATISGYTSLYVKPGSKESVFNFENSELSGSITNDDIVNEFGTLAVRANNVTVNVDAQSTVSATGNNYYAMDFRSGSIQEEQGKTGIKIKIEGTITGSILPSSEELKGNEVMVKSEYVAQFSEEDGYKVSEAVDNLITITASDQE